MSSVANVGAWFDPVPVQEHPLERGSAHKTHEHGNHSAAPLAGDSAPKSEAQQKHSVASADLEKISLVFNKRLQFVVDHQSQELIVKIIDKETDKVIKVLPPEELQRLHNKLKETIGFLFDQQV